MIDDPAAVHLQMYDEEWKRVVVKMKEKMWETRIKWSAGEIEGEAAKV
jgi:hypothetical protein